MAKIIAYEVNVNGIQGVIQNQEDLRKAIKQTNKEYKNANFGTPQAREAEKQLASLKNIQKKQRDDLRKTQREQTIAADKGRKSYRSLSAELTNLRNNFKDLSKQERKTFGKDMLKRINTLDKELKDIDASMGNYQRNVGNYANAFADLGGIDLSALLTGPGAIVAIGSAAIKAGQYVLELTKEFRQLRGEISTLTDASGQELDEYTARIASISDTFQADRGEILNAANAVANQLDISFSEALTHIEEGFVAGSNQTGEFLDSLKEYPAFFQEAGLSADSMFKILNQQATEGIYSDKGVDAIKEVTLRLREMPKATSAALQQIGLDSSEIKKQIENEGIGSAIATVSKRLGELEKDSPQVGQALADIFGGPGEDAGVEFITSLQTIDEETTALIDSSNEYQQQQLKTLEVNREFAEVQNEIAVQLSGTGVSFETLGTKAKTVGLELLSNIIGVVQRLWTSLDPLRDSLFKIGQTLGVVEERGEGTNLIFKAIQFQIDATLKIVEFFAKGLSLVVDEVDRFVSKGRQYLEWMGLAKKRTEETTKTQNDYKEKTEETNKEQEKYNKVVEQSSKSTNDFKKAIKGSAVVTDAYAKNSIVALRDEVSKLKKELDQTAPENQQSVLEKLIGAEKALEQAENARKVLRRNLTEGLNTEVGAIGTLTVGSVSSTTDTVSIAQEIADKQVDINAKKNEEIKKQDEELLATIQEGASIIFGGINDAISLISESSSISTDNQILDAENYYNTRIQLAEGNEEEQDRLEQELADKKSAIEKKEFEQQKKYRVATAYSSLAEGIVNILSAPSVIPDPAGAIFKAVRVGVLTGTTAKQIKNIKKQRIAARGTIVDGFAKGDSHSASSGGIQTLLNGVPVMIEGNEFVDYDEYGGVAVVNKRSSLLYKGTLKSVFGKTFAGKRDMLSAINSTRGYGVKYAEQGINIKPAASTYSGSSVGSVTISDSSINKIATTTAVAVKQGAKEGVGMGLGDANRRMEREQQLSKRTQV